MDGRIKGFGLEQLGGLGSFVAQERVAEEGEDPWLCGPGFRRVCHFEDGLLMYGGVQASSSAG